MLWHAHHVDCTTSGRSFTMSAARPLQPPTGVKHAARRPGRDARSAPRRRRRPIGDRHRTRPRGNWPTCREDELEHLAEEYGLDPTRLQAPPAPGRRDPRPAADDRGDGPRGDARRRPLGPPAGHRQREQGADRPGDRPDPLDALRRPVAARPGRARPPARRRRRRARTTGAGARQKAQAAGGLLRQAQPQAAGDARVDRLAHDRRGRGRRRLPVTSRRRRPEHRRPRRRHRRRRRPATRASRRRSRSPACSAASPAG